MDVLFYLSPFLTAFFLSIGCIILLRMLATRLWKRDSRQGERHIHQSGISRFGGIALIVSFLITIFLNEHLVLTRAWWGVIVVSILILIVGLRDDVREISWKSQLAMQAIAGGAAFAFGIRMLSLVNPFGEAFFFDTGWMLGVSFVATILWIVIVMNAVNWADGIDGLCGGVSFIGFMTIFVLSLRPEVNQPPVAILSLILAGGSLGFLAFNFYPARIFAGTSGSWFLGFMLAVLALFSGTKIATAILVLLLPLLDALWVILDRFLSGVSIFSSDKRHLHHRLQKIGWSSRSITLLLYSVTILIAMIALRVNAREKMVLFGVVGAIVILFFIWIQKRMQQ